MSGLRVAFLTLDPDSASARVRVSDHLDGLRAEEIEGELIGLPKGWLARRRLFGTLGDRDVVVLHRVLLGENEAVALRRAANTLVLDMDDAIYRRPFRETTSRSLTRKFERTLATVDLVTVGNLHLREELRGSHPRVRLLPPASPLPGASGRPEREEGPVRIVWTGSRATLPYLEALGPVLERLGESVLLEVVADVAPRLPSGVTVRFQPWSLDAEEEVLARSDIGIYPLSDDAWSRGKSAYKLRRYMVFGLPSVASPYGGGAEVLDAPTAGLVADTPQEWEDCLRRLVEEPQLRARMGQRALSLALGRDALGDRTHSLAQILREAAAVGASRKA